MKREPVKVSVIIPAYNVQEFLTDCVESVRKQSLTDIEMICVDDGSTDRTAEMLEELKKEDPRIHVIHKENGGLSSARNAGMREAAGEYLLFLDSDDYIEADALEILYLYAKHNCLDELFYNASAFFDSKELEDKHKEYTAYYTRKGTYEEIVSGRDLFMKMQKNGDFKPSACLQMLRRQFLEENRLSFREGILHEDNLFTLQCVSLAVRAGMLDREFYKRRVRAGSIMTEEKGFQNAYGKFISVMEMLTFIEQHSLCEHTDFYMALLKQLSVLCDAASMDISAMGESEISDYIAHMDEKERSAFILLITHLKDVRERVKKRTEAAAAREKSEISARLENCEEKYKKEKDRANSLAKENRELKKEEDRANSLAKENRKLKNEEQRLEKEKEDIRKALLDTQNSLTFRIGSVITAVPKKIRRLLKKG